MRMFRKLRLILDSVMGSIKTMIWAMVLIGTVSFMFGVCFLQATTMYLQGDPDLTHAERQELLDRFGSVLKSMTSLYKSCTGGIDWEAVSTPLKRTGGVIYCIFFMYVGLFHFVLSNTVTSLFVESTIENANKDDDLVIHEKLRMRKEYVKRLTVWFKRMDDGSGNISFDEFCKRCEDPEMVAFASSLDVEILDVKQFFSALSSRGRHPVDLDTFVVGCIKLKGLAKSMDLLELMENHKQVSRVHERQFTRILRRLDAIYADHNFSVEQSMFQARSLDTAQSSNEPSQQQIV